MTEKISTIDVRRAAGGPLSVKKHLLPALCLALLFTPDAMADPASAEMNVSTFFSQFVTAGGPIVWLLLIPMSVITVYLALDLAFSIRRRRLLPQDLNSLLTVTYRTSPAKLAEKLSRNKDLVSQALAYAVRHSTGREMSGENVGDLAAESLTNTCSGLLKKVEWCSIIGNVAPMVGLFGTVYGMIKAFNILGIAGGQPKPDQLATAISVALITTFWGLLVAIPALAVYGIYKTRLDLLISEAAIQSEQILRKMPRAAFINQQPAAAQAPRTKNARPVRDVKNTGANKQNNAENRQIRNTAAK